MSTSTWEARQAADLANEYRTALLAIAFAVDLEHAKRIAQLALGLEDDE
jgi:hypothetical protein